MKSMSPTKPSYIMKYRPVAPGWSLNNFSSYVYVIYATQTPIEFYVLKFCLWIKLLSYLIMGESEKHISLMLMLPNMPVISAREWISLGKCVWGHTFPGGTHITVTTRCIPFNVIRLCKSVFLSTGKALERGYFST